MTRLLDALSTNMVHRMVQIPVVLSICRSFRKPSSGDIVPERERRKHYILGTMKVVANK